MLTSCDTVAAGADGWLREVGREVFGNHMDSRKLLSGVDHWRPKLPPPPPFSEIL